MSDRICSEGIHLGIGGVMADHLGRAIIVPSCFPAAASPNEGFEAGIEVSPLLVHPPPYFGLDQRTLF